MGIIFSYNAIFVREPDEAFVKHQQVIKVTPFCTSYPRSPEGVVPDGNIVKAEYSHHAAVKMCKLKLFALSQDKALSAKKNLRISYNTILMGLNFDEVLCSNFKIICT